MKGNDVFYTEREIEAAGFGFALVAAQTLLEEIQKTSIEALDIVSVGVVELLDLWAWLSFNK